MSDSLDSLKDMLQEPEFMFIAVKMDGKDGNAQPTNDYNMLAFILQRESNYSENMETIKAMAKERNIPMESEVIIVNIYKHGLSKEQVEMMAQDIVDAINEGEDADYDPVRLRLADIID